MGSCLGCLDFSCLGARSMAGSDRFVAGVSFGGSVTIVRNLLRFCWAARSVLSQAVSGGAFAFFIFAAREGFNI